MNRALSLKASLLIGVNAIVLVILLLTGWASYRNILHELDELFDAELAQTARLVRSLTHDPGFLEQGTHPVVIELPRFNDNDNGAEGDERLLDGHRYESKIAFQVWQDERLLLASENALTSPLAEFRLGYQANLVAEHHWISFVYYDRTTDLWIVTAQRDDVRSELSGYLALDQLAALLLMWLPISLAMLLLINWVLAPVSAYATQLRQRQADQLQPVTTALPKEIAPMRDAVNQLFARIVAQRQQEQRFIQDAAHELRTPLAALQVHSQQLPQPQHASVQAVQQVAKRMSHLVNQLLLLAKTEHAGEETFGQRQHVSLRALIEQCLAELPSDDLERAEWQLKVSSELTLNCYPTLLQIALRNLLENALKYGGDAPQITVTAESQQQQLLITVSDQGPGLATEQLALLGERFFRAEQHRQHADGVGLGLSIVERVTQLHGGQLWFTTNHPQGLSAHLLLPC